MAEPGAGLPPALAQRQEPMARGGTMGPERGAPGAAQSHGDRDHCPGAQQAANECLKLSRLCASNEGPIKGKGTSEHVEAT